GQDLALWVLVDQGSDNSRLSDPGLAGDQKRRGRILATPFVQIFKEPLSASEVFTLFEQKSRKMPRLEPARADKAIRPSQSPRAKRPRTPCGRKPHNDSSVLLLIVQIAQRSARN